MLTLNNTNNYSLSTFEGGEYNVVLANDLNFCEADIIGSNVSSIVDIDLSIKINNMYKFVIWYDNEYGYSSKIVDLIFHIMKN